MDTALSPFYSGDLNQPVKVKKWDSRLKSRADFQTLEASELKLIVAVLFINPIWGSVEHQFDQQMEALNLFCAQHSSWKIVSEPAEAQSQIALGNKVIILSVEGAWFFKNKEEFVRLMEKHKIRIVTPLHFSDVGHTIGKPAAQKGLFGPIQRFVDFFIKDIPGDLNPLGKELLQYLLDHKIWIDLSHSSEKVVDYFLEIRPKDYPLLVTHTILKKYYDSDRGVDDKLLKLVKQEQGAIGLLPSSEMLINTPTSNQSCQHLNPYLVQWLEMTQTAGLENVFLGSDLNAPIAGLPPEPVGANCANPILPDGLKTAADLKALLQFEHKNSIKNFLQRWQRVRR